MGARCFTGGRRLHAALRLDRETTSPRPLRLHILYPEQSYRDALWDAIFPPALLGGVTLVLAALMGAGIAARVSRPMGRLQVQVNKIAEGDFRPMHTKRPQILANSATDSLHHRGAHCGGL